MTDVPSIVSSDKLAYLDPQEKLWDGQSGRLFKLSEVVCTDNLSPFHGIADFNSRNTSYYPKTLFRFPLRTAASNLSENVYTLEKLLELTNALKAEAKLLLIFLRSVTSIEVFEINNSGVQTLLFQTKISDKFLPELTQKRSDLMQKVGASYEQHQYTSSVVHSFITRFDVSTYDKNTRTTTHWLVANQVGSSITKVREASVKQKVFPWVGVALELDSPGDGRIFCFLPMPIEVASNLPVHINGTFSLNDDRRSLKWPGIERRNDPMANWNDLLVINVVPSCYINLLLAAKNVMGAHDFYRAWPIVRDLRSTHWEGILLPLFSTFLKSDIVWSEAMRQPGEWVIPTSAVYVPQSITRLKAVVEKTLTRCGVLLAKVPDHIRDSFLLVNVKVKEVNPAFVRDSMHANISSYRNIDSVGKLELLRYCLSDGNYADLDQLELLPLANGNFHFFQKLQFFNVRVSPVYLCTSECPRSLLPNLDHRLCDLSGDADLHKSLTYIASSNQTQLTALSLVHISRLIDEAMPEQWRNLKIVHFPCGGQFPSDWFRIFWDWVSNKNLKLFSNKLVVPVQQAVTFAPDQFSVIRLASSQAVLYLPHHLAIGSEMMSLLAKFGVMCSSQNLFSYLSHPDLAAYILSYSSDNILAVICKNGLYGTITLTSIEAKCLRSSLASAKNPNLTAMRNIKIFMTSKNTKSEQLSVNDVCKKSALRRGVVEPPNLQKLISALPDTMVLFTNSDSIQQKLLEKLGICAHTQANFVKDFIFPCIQNGTISDPYIDSVMRCVLDAFQILSYNNSSITESIKNLRFLKDGLGQRKCPHQLFNPNNKAMALIFQGENIFPETPYNTSSYIQILQSCGLRETVSAQEILDLIFSISVSYFSSPQLVGQVKITRAKAIIAYIQTHDFKSKIAGSYKINKSIHPSYLPFDVALLLLSENRSWLPVQARAPSFYCCLPWRGSECVSHFVSLNSTTCVSCSSCQMFPLLYGSQAYFTTQLDDEIFQWLGSHEPTGCLIPHFCEIISHKDDVDADTLLYWVSNVYSAMQELLQNNDTSHIGAVSSVKEWIYIRKYGQFVDIEAVAEQKNSNFHHNIEPYLHILPDSISRYSALFTYFGMNKCITKTQIISILGTMKSEISSGCHPSTPSLVWDTLMAILNWLTDNGTRCISVDYILVPAESVTEWPDLREVEELVYTDNDFLKEFAISSAFVDEPTLTFVHSRISPSLAKCLRVKPLTEELGVSEDTFADAGQCEPLTVRLKNILKDYKDGLTIVKELIQNADDAEATEINICFDARSHNEQRSLFFPGMQESHGPALVVHNNSTFRDEDFANIQKLAAATKQEKHLKIGKFGIGFCSVYHITDVPSFISRNMMYIFDPTLKHLRKEIKNPSQPGKMIKYLSKVIQRSCQLSPYEGLFGFCSSTEFQGTIFRLPFRSAVSELSSTCYTEAHVKELFDGIRQCGDKLVLFLQHVKKITIQQIEEGQNHPIIVHEISKCTSGEPLNLDQTYLTSKVTIETKGVCVMKTTCTDWLVANAKVSSRNSPLGSWVIDTQNKGKPAVASVACLLNGSNESNTVYTLDSALDGEMFCYLPLSQSTGLPVHISCNFAVINNRRGIWTSAEASSQSDSEVQWNIHVVTKVIPVAYIRLLCCLRDLQKKEFLQNYQFHYLWPLIGKLQMKNPWKEFVAVFYNKLACEKLFYSDSTTSWLKVDDSRFLESNILRNSGVLPCVVDVINHLKLPLVHLPSLYRSQLSLANETISENDFVELFFNSLSDLSDQGIMCSRDEVILCMLEAYTLQKRSSSPLFQQLTVCFNTYACIPCRPQGSVLLKCSELIHPKAHFSALFDESENMFPIDLLVSQTTATEALKEAGMMHDRLPWNYVLERAQTISNLFKTNPIKALERVRLLLTTLTKHVSGEPPANGTTLDLVPFLPVLKKPESYPFGWCGENHLLLCGRELMISNPIIKNTLIAGSTVPFVCESMPDKGGCGSIDWNARELLHLRSSPTSSEVIAHLKDVVNQQSDSIDKELVTETCRSIYDFLDSALKSGNTSVDVKGIQVIWNEHQFISTDMIATCWRWKEGPYLYSLPDILADKRELVNALHIQNNFSYEDAQKALQMMKNDFHDEPVSHECQQLIQDIILVFSEAFVKHEDLKQESVQFSLYLPDEHSVLRRSSELAYNDAGWCPKDKDYNYVHTDIPRNLAAALGVRMMKSKWLDRFISNKTYFGGTKFGQHEDLTRRIQNILRDYPLDITILKELLQNSDDAKAKKMYFILDMRTHGKESLISENWQKLQGPALLVWNDSTFSEDDLKGIQELGLGSKRSEAETIGQYGIGFNVVYHLTDCPSFVTGGETLCIMDPHCQYADGATELSPGQRYDKLNEGFWEKFSDMSSSYLKEGLENIPRELQDGTLFRFPIRHSSELMKSSKILDQDNISLKPLTAVALSQHLEEWMPSMKRAMLFLNYVTEIKYIVIEPDSNTLKTVCHFQSKIPELSMFDQELTALKGTISQFKEVTNCQASAALYPLTITEYKSEHPNESQENWLVQQGIGDLKNSKQVWQYVRTIKPRHGIAAPLKMPQLCDDQQGQLFCFLPLPVKSQVPVHVHGNFILNSTRRDLWKATDPNEMDDKSRWNANIFQAIASLYADLLMKGRKYYLNQSYEMMGTALNDLTNYYQIFPGELTLKASDKNQLFHKVFKILVQDKAAVLCVFQSEAGSITTQWHPIISECISDQVYFGYGTYCMTVHPVLECLGMKITSAVKTLRQSLNAVLVKEHLQIPLISCASVFEYYTQYSSFSSGRGMQSCLLSKTVFCDVKAFTVFLRYLLRMPQKISKEGGDFQSNVRSGIQNYELISTTSISSDSCLSRADTASITGEFPKPPFSHFLLLSADGKLKTFEEDEDLKIFSSDFCNLFPANHQNKFLHPDLRDLELHPSYFIGPCNPVKLNALRILNIFLEIFKDTFPSKMLSDCVIPQASSLISKQSLVKFWECFSKDQVFRTYLPCLLKKVALLLTLDDRLFSASSELLPVCHRSGESNTLERVMTKLKMPFLDTSVVTVLTDYPTLDDHARILKNIIYLHNKNSLTGVLENNEVDILICYFGLNSLMKGSLDYMLLPFFEDFTGVYQSIQGGMEAYIWPNCCLAGYQSWFTGCNAIFIKPRCSWTCIGTAENFSIQCISRVKLYYHFIFPHFGKMTEKDRYEHLEYIRDGLFSNANFKRKQILGKHAHNSETKEKCEAQIFYQGLLALKCIGSESSDLLQISSFCDHTQNIFCVFSKHLKKLPEFFQSKNWLLFFRDLGLKQNLTEDEYLQLCQATAESKTDITNRTSSTALLKYLFSEKVLKEWCSKTIFLAKVSNIPFVCAEKAARVDWVVPGAYQANQLVQLNGSAPVHWEHLVWTFRPIIRLPECVKEIAKELLQNLGVVVQPRALDVVSNIRNICKSLYSENQLFSNYPNAMLPPAGEIKASNLLEILKKNFTFLSRCSDHSCFRELSSLPCIPVFVDLCTKDMNKMVLVQPDCVVSSRGKCHQFHPFLHKLPAELSRLSGTLNEIGVESTINLHHMQIVLEKAHKNTDSLTLDPNTQKTVKSTIAKLKQLLMPHAGQHDGSAQQLTPLYLPDSQDSLKISTSLLYRDIYSCFHHLEVDLSNTPYSYFNIREDTYGSSALDLCCVLPLQVCPKRISEECKELLDKECQLVESSQMELQLRTSFQDENNSENLVKVINMFVPNLNQGDLIKQQVEKLLLSMHIATVCHLRAQIVLTENNITIGYMKSESFCQRDDSEYHLYIDSDLDDVHTITRVVANLILRIVCQCMDESLTTSTTCNLIDSITAFLKSTPSKKMALLESFCIDGTISYGSGLDLSQLGVTIPQSYHHRLDHDPNNIFKPMEYVGYEITESEIIVAQVAYLVPAEAESSSFLRKYRIYIKTDDKVGRDVSILVMYKFIVGHKKPKVTSKGIQDGSMSLVLHNDGDEMSNLRASLQESTLTDKKKKICDQLKDIWKLNPELKRKALKRLYLKYHPDKNLDNPEESEILFLFLQAQIAHLDNGEPLDDPSVQGSNVTREQPCSSKSRSRRRDYGDWNATARKHRKAERQEQSTAPYSGAERQEQTAAPNTNPFFFWEREVDKRNPAEGRRWVRQAEVDLRVIRSCLNQASSNCDYAHVCFMAHQVVEKALKGAVYALCGVDSRNIEDYNLSKNALALQTVKPVEACSLLQHSEPLESYYLDTRYPNRWEGYTDIPSDHYQEEEAESAKVHAEEVLRIVKSLMPLRRVDDFA